MPEQFISDSDFPVQVLHFTVQDLSYHSVLAFPLGSRIKETHDFGFVTLDLMSVVPEDAGVYMCRAVNLAGEAVTSASIHVHG